MLSNVLLDTLPNFWHFNYFCFIFLKKSYIQYHRLVGCICNSTWCYTGDNTFYLFIFFRPFYKVYFILKEVVLTCFTPYMMNGYADSVGPAFYHFTPSCLFIKSLQSWPGLHSFLVFSFLTIITTRFCTFFSIWKTLMAHLAYYGYLLGSLTQKSGKHNS